MVVNHPRCDDLTIGADFWFDDAFDALGTGVSFNREISIVDADERVGLDPFGAPGIGGTGRAAAWETRVRSGGISDNLDVVAERRCFPARTPISISSAI